MDQSRAGEVDTHEADRVLHQYHRAAREPHAERRLNGRLVAVLTAFGVAALSFMMIMYAFEHRHRGFVLAFTVGCALSSAYGFLSGAWPFGFVEAVWTIIAIRRWLTTAPAPTPSTGNQ